MADHNCRVPTKFQFSKGHTPPVEHYFIGGMRSCNSQISTALVWLCVHPEKSKDQRCSGCMEQTKSEPSSWDILKIPAIPDEKLPDLAHSESWRCGKCCGETEPILTDHNYREVRDEASGDLIHSRKGKIWVSKCCGADLYLGKKIVQDGFSKVVFFSWKPANSSEIEFAAHF